MYLLFVLLVANTIPGSDNYLEESFDSMYQSVEECWEAADQLTGPEIFSVRCQLEY